MHIWGGKSTCPVGQLNITCLIIKKKPWKLPVQLRLPCIIWSLINISTFFLRFFKKRTKISFQNLFILRSTYSSGRAFSCRNAVNNFTHNDYSWIFSTVELARTCIGTPYYLSPEICENRPYNNKRFVLTTVVHVHCMKTKPLYM